MKTDIFSFFSPWMSSSRKITFNYLSNSLLTNYISDPIYKGFFIHLNTKHKRKK